MNNKNHRVATKYWNMTLCLPGVQDSLVAALGKNCNINDWFTGKAKIIKTDAYSQVGLIETEALGTIYAKRYRAKSWWHRMAMLFNQGRPVKSYNMSVALSSRGLPVPAPYAVIRDKGSLGFPNSSYYLCQGLTGAEDLKSFYLGCSENPSEMIKDYLLNIGRQLAELHNRGYLHGDCKWSNLLLQGTQLFFVDLDNAGKIIERDAEAKDLARFILNAEELAIGQAAYDGFLNAYRETRNNASPSLMASCKGQLEKLRIRHWARYGERGQRLMS